MQAGAGAGGGAGARGVRVKRKELLGWGLELEWPRGRRGWRGANRHASQTRSCCCWLALLIITTLNSCLCSWGRTFEPVASVCPSQIDMSHGF